MMFILQSAAAFIVALGILITFHEFGHYWVARRCNVKILRFSIGFGRPLLKRHFGPDRSEFVIAALPLGGYVRMLDEREGTVEPDELQRAFNRRPLRERFLIVAAGPVFNLLFAVAAYWMIYLAGIPGLRPIVDSVIDGTPAAAAGLVPGDEIIAVEGLRTPTWSAVADALVSIVVNGAQSQLTVRGALGGERELAFDMTRISVDDLADGGLLGRIGVKPRRPPVPALIGEITPGGAAERGGLQVGDTVTAVDGEPVRDWFHWVETVRSHPGRLLQVEVQRGAELRTLALQPDAVNGEDGKSVGRIGATARTPEENDPHLVAVETYGFFPALLRAVVKTVDMSLITLRVLGKMIVGEASIKNLSGPISIAQFAGQSAAFGLASFLGFLAIISVSLGVLNLLPIPILDGGHLMYYLIELVKGSPVSESVQAAGQQAGVVVLLMLMGLALYNDVLRLVG